MGTIPDGRAKYATPGSSPTGCFEAPLAGFHCQFLYVLSYTKTKIFLRHKFLSQRGEKVTESYSQPQFKYKR
jgi:hypothetical protein